MHPPSDQGRPGRHCRRDPQHGEKGGANKTVCRFLGRAAPSGPPAAKKERAGPAFFGNSNPLLRIHRKERSRRKGIPGGLTGYLHMKIKWGVIGCGGIADRRTIPACCSRTTPSWWP